MNSEETGIDNTVGGYPSPDREDEIRYRMAVEAADLGTWDFFPLSGEMVWSDKCRALFGVRPQDTVNYSVFLDHIHNDDRDRINHQLQRARTPSDNQNLDCEFRTTAHVEGQPQWVRLKGKVIFDEDMQATRFICAVLDVTDRRADSLKKTIDLERSNQNLEEFAYMASHDLQEPLRKIRIFTQILQERMSPVLQESARTYLDKINSAAIRMGALIKSLLDYSRLADKPVLFTQTDLNEMIRTVLNDLEISISRSDAIVVADKLPVVEAIPIQIVQLFTNLVSNALKFSCEGVPPQIHIKARELKPKDVISYPSLNQGLRYAEIVVSDNGIGFDPAFAEQIFGIFQRLHGQNQYEGTGIGLSICRKIVNNHNGLIFADSKKGEGTCFHVILPFKQK